LLVINQHWNTGTGTVFLSYETVYESSISIGILAQARYFYLMKQFISHRSALEYWRRCRKLPKSSHDRRCRDALPNGPFKIEPLELVGFALPIHIMIGNPNARRNSKKVKQHVFSGETPVGCFMNIGNGLMMSSPEFCFLQMADNITLARLIELGYELCGKYSIPIAEDSDVPERGFHNRTPLTSTNRIRAFLDSMHGFNGFKKATHALSYMIDGSASPMETKLTMFLTLHYMLGGFGFNLPELNKRIILTKTARKYFRKNYYVCDLFWPDKNVAVEYDSDQQHTGSDRIANDSKRRNVLESSGIRVITVTKQQLFSSVELERAARTIAKHLNKRLFPTKSNFYTAHQELREQLLEDFYN